MAVSPDGSLLAVGRGDPSDCQIFHIQHQNRGHPTFTRSRSLVVCPDWHSAVFQSEVHTAIVVYQT